MSLKRRATIQLTPTSTPKKRRLAQAQMIMRVPRNNLANSRSRSRGPELKFVDVAGSVGTTGIGYWSELDFLNPIDTGSSASQRIGRKVQLRSILFRWNGSSIGANVAYRILIVYDREPNGVLPTLLDVIEGDNYNSPMNLSNGNRFIVLADEMHGNEGYSSGGGAGSPQYYRTGKIYKKINLQAGYNALSNLTISSITQGAVFVMCSVPLNASTGQGIGYWSRIRYTDV